MPASGKRRKPSKNFIWIGSGAVVLVVALIIVVAVKLLLTDTMQEKKRTVHQVKLLKPPKPPEVKKKPPPPKKEEKKIEQKVKKEKPKPMEDKQQDKPPMDENLGVDAEGEAGGDAFGLQGKKGGSALIGSGGGGSLMRKYAWYNQLIEKTIRSHMNDIFEKNGGIPDGNLKTTVDIFLNEQGNIVDFSIHGSSGNHSMDETVKKALKRTRISKKPPDGMPRGMRITISSRG
mgnify:CR=1 FL=1